MKLWEGGETDRQTETAEDCLMWNHRSLAPLGPLPKNRRTKQEKKARENGEEEVREVRRGEIDDLGRSSHSGENVAIHLGYKLAPQHERVISHSTCQPKIRGT